MSGFNLPPGCSVSDLPGNTPEDQAAEALTDALYEALGGVATEELVEKLSTIISKAWADGYSHGQRDAGEAGLEAERDLLVGTSYEDEEPDERLM